MNPTYLLAWLPETLLNEKGQTEWDKFIRTEERMTVEEEEGTLLYASHTLPFLNVHDRCGPH